MVPLDKVKDIVSKHDNLEKELSSGSIDPKLFAKKSKEYSNCTARHSEFSERLSIFREIHVCYRQKFTDILPRLKLPSTDAYQLWGSRGSDPRLKKNPRLLALSPAAQSSTFNDRQRLFFSLCFLKKHNRDSENFLARAARRKILVHLVDA